MIGPNPFKVPEMSVVLLTPDRYERIRKSVSCLADQTRSKALELVIVSPSVLHDAQDERLHAFHTVKFVQSGPFKNSGHPRAAGVAQCSAPVVGFAEDHCFLSPKWAETMIRLHGEGWAAVCPAMGNANPGAVSWADLLLNFGAWTYPAPAGNIGETAWHNTSYRRELLYEYGERLRQSLEPEFQLQQDLVRQGHRLYMAGDLEAKHVNVSRLQSFLLSQFCSARFYGYSRAHQESWGLARRLVYAAAFPLIPSRRARILIAGAKRSMRQGKNAAFLLASMGGLLAGALGEATGYLLGTGGATPVRLSCEFDRVRHLRAADRGLLA